MIGILFQSRTALCALALLTMLTLTGTCATGPAAPLRRREPTLIPAVAIKTQEAADSIQGGIRGIDVSKYQGEIDWPRVGNENVKFVVARASVGTAVDETFDANVRGAKGQGLAVGAYHYARFKDETSVEEEAALFLDQLSGHKLTYPVFLDIEDNKDNRDLSRRELTRLCKRFLELLEDNGHTVMVYTGSYFLRDRLVASELSGYDFWVANYLRQPAADHKIWQHTSYGSVAGIEGNVCIDIAYEDLSLHRKVTVDKTVSNAIKAAMNRRYGANLALEGLDLAALKAAAVSALQSELILRHGGELAVTGTMDVDTARALAGVPLTPGETSGTIPHLLQVMLFYKGLYTGEPTATYDCATAEALNSYAETLGAEPGDPAVLTQLFS